MAEVRAGGRGAVVNARDEAATAARGCVVTAKAKRGWDRDLERSLLHRALYVVLFWSVLGYFSPNAMAPAPAGLVGTVALAGLACSCRRPD